MKPPPAGEGIQLHFGPKSYTDSTLTGPYLIEPGAALNSSMLAHIPLTEDRWFGRVTVHMRPGPHHWISTGAPADVDEGIYPDWGCGQGQLFGEGGFGGGQNLIYDNPPGGVPAPENAEIVRQIRGNSSACLGVHAINATDQPILREAWVNIHFVDKPANVQTTGGIGLFGGTGLNLPPGEKVTQTHAGTFSADGRIIQLYGVRYRWTPRLAAWLNDRLIYDSRDWEAAVTFNYDSLTQNPDFDPAGMHDGAVSGILEFKAGDTLRYSCFVDNTSDKPLSFPNERNPIGEMCHLMGATIGGSLSDAPQQ